MRPIRTILLATDLTAASREATDRAIDLAGRLEARGESLERLFMIAPAVSRLDGLALAEQCALTIIQPDDDEVIELLTDQYAFLFYHLGVPVGTGETD